MNLYTTLAAAKDELRRAKDHEQTIRAIVESTAETSGKNADARKSELTLVLTQNSLYRSALEELRTAEYNVDEAQADIDQAESERRDREWQIRARLADALREKHDSNDPFDDATLSQITDAIQRIAQSRNQYAGVAREMLNAYNTGMADRVNGAGEFEEDDDYADAAWESDHGSYNGTVPSDYARAKAQAAIDDLYPTK